MSGALVRYRVVAWVVGVLLLLLTLVAMPMKYLAGNDLGVALVAPVHGWLYVCYLIASGDLARRAEWTVTRTLLVAIAGTIPFFSFIMERKVRLWMTTPEQLKAVSAES